MKNEDRASKPHKFNQWQHIVDYTPGGIKVGEKVKVKKEVFLTKHQAEELNAHTRNSGKSYELVEEKPKSKGRPKKEETKTEE